ncbi:hypothetical protein HK101_002857 [Irineochytrium annulatum]|nr:hypothetical protein HK101_002857 [Irineochytrium annulatum]
MGPPAPGMYGYPVMAVQAPLAYVTPGAPPTPPPVYKARGERSSGRSNSRSRSRSRSKGRRASSKTREVVEEVEDEEKLEEEIGQDDLDVDDYPEERERQGRSSSRHHRRRRQPAPEPLHEEDDEVRLIPTTAAERHTKHHRQTRPRKPRAPSPLPLPPIAPPPPTQPRVPLNPYRPLSVISSLAAPPRVPLSGCQPPATGTIRRSSPPPRTATTLERPQPQQQRPPQRQQQNKPRATAFAARFAGAGVGGTGVVSSRFSMSGGGSVKPFTFSEAASAYARLCQRERGNTEGDIEAAGGKLERDEDLLLASFFGDKNASMLAPGVDPAKTKISRGNEFEDWSNRLAAKQPPRARITRGARASSKSRRTRPTLPRLALYTSLALLLALLALLGYLYFPRPATIHIAALTVPPTQGPNGTQTSPYSFNETTPGDPGTLTIDARLLMAVSVTNPNRYGLNVEGLSVKVYLRVDADRLGPELEALGALMEHVKWNSTHGGAAAAGAGNVTELVEAARNGTLKPLVGTGGMDGVVGFPAQDTVNLTVPFDVHWTAGSPLSRDPVLGEVLGACGILGPNYSGGGKSSGQLTFDWIATGQVQRLSWAGVGGDVRGSVSVSCTGLVRDGQVQQVARLLAQGMDPAQVLRAVFGGGGGVEGGQGSGLQLQVNSSSAAFGRY